MADLKLVGAVAIKVRPDATGFRREAQKELDKELKDVKGKVPVKAEFDEGKVEEDAEKLEKKLDGKTVSWNVKLDHDSVRAAQKQFDSMLEPTKEISFKLGDTASIEKAREDLEKLAKEAKVKISYHEDEKGWQSALDKIAAIRRERLEKTIHIDTSDEELDKWEKDFREKLDALHPEVEIQTKSMVDIEYHEDREGFQAAINRINAELRKLDAMTLSVELDRDELLAARDLMQESMDKEPLIFKYNEDEAGYKKILRHIKEIQDKKAEIDIDLNLSDAELVAKAAEIQAKLDALTPAQVHVTETVTFKYNQDREGLESVIKQINSKIREIEAINLTVELDRDKLIAEREKAQLMLDGMPMKFEYDNNVAGLRKVIAEIDAQIAKHNKLVIESTLDEASLKAAKAKAEAELGKQKVHIEYETDDLASLKAARARIMALLPIHHKTHLTTELNEASLLDALGKIDAMIKAATPEVKVKVKPEPSAPDFIKAAAAIKLLAKSQTVDIFVKVNNTGLLLAAAKLTGLRAASRWTEAFARSLGTLDRNLPILAAAVLGVNALTSGFISLTASAFSLGNDLGNVVRMAALLAPAMILGFAAVKTVMQGVFKDFGAAVNGDSKAIEKLTESGKKAAANMRVIFQDIRETVSKNFWAEASDNMLRFTEVALPQVRDGMAKLSTSMGGVFGSIVDATTKFAQEDGFKVFFTNLVRGFDNVKDGMGPFMAAFLNLAALGSTIFPRLGAAFEVMSGKFDSWVKGLALDGTFNRWIDMGVQGIKDLWTAGMSLIGVWKNIGQAAQGAGALTLSSFAGMMAKLEEVTSGYRFQTNLSRIFRGAREGSDEFHKSLSNLGPAMDSFSVTMGNALANSGKALGAFINVLGDVLSSPNIDKGLTAFLSGIKTMFEELRPAAAPITEIFRTFGEILGAVATDSGPLFRTLFTQLATVLTTAWHALEPFLPALIQVGTTILDVLAPALDAAAGTLIPAFATGVLEIGNALTPVIAVLGVFATMIGKWAANMQLDDLVAMAGFVLALGGAFKFASTVVPIAAAALEFFGITAGLTAARVQLMVPVVGIFLAALTGLALGGIAGLAGSMGSSVPYANEYETAIREDAKAVKELDDAIGAATTRLTIKKLVDSGAYEAAQKLGISTLMVTEAVTKGGKAWDDIQGKIANAEYSYNNLADVQAATGDSSQELVSKITMEKSQYDILKKALNDTTGSRDKALQVIRLQEEQEKAAGVATEEHAEKTDLLTEALKKQKSQIGAAAQATGVLTDAFSSSAAKVDAMRKTFDILLGKDAKQSAAETLGAYAKGFNDLKENVTPLAQDMRNLGDAVYGENGFLNVAGGNKAVLQVNQALVDEVNNVWVGAKAAYDAAIKQGKTAQGAFEEAQKFIADHKGDYNALAEASGVSADMVQGQWDAVFGHEWVLRVSLSGATEAATRAQELITALGGSFDGKTFTAWLDANPDQAMLAIQSPVDAATNFVNSTWRATLDALPDPAKDVLRGLKGLTEDEWNRGDFQAILRAAQQIPGLPEALVQIRNGASNNGNNWQAIIYAALNGSSIAEAQRQLDNLAASRTAYITALVTRKDAMAANGTDYNGAASGDGTPGFANGGIIKGWIQQFANGGITRPVHKYASGGFENHVAQIQRAGGPVRVWAEPETKAEAYIPYAQAKRPRSLAILAQVAKDFGYTLSKATQSYADGGFAGHTTSSPTTNANVSIGTLYTVDADEAVRKIRNSQADALAVAGITLTGA